MDLEKCNTFKAQYTRYIHKECDLTLFLTTAIHKLVL